MELRELQYFLTVVQEENISRAAEVLHITQPTLSRQMAQLEEELGAQLFVRGKHLVLTDAGIMLCHRAEEVVGLMEKIETEFEDMNDVTGNIAIEGSVSLFEGSRMTFRPLEPEMVMTSVLAWKKMQPNFGVAQRFLDYFKTIHKTDGRPG